ncbi:MAG: 3-oxoacyl-ACP synthase III family protein [Myxococcaceae bacterium]
MYLHSVGHFHPPNVIDNAFLESLDIGTDDAWISERVGIKRRHTVLPLSYIKETKNRDVRQALEAAEFSNAETGAKAAEMALARAGLKASDIGMVISGGCSPDECIPAEANRVSELLNIDAPSLDINSACSSFCSQLHFLHNMRPEALPDYVLVVNPENSTRVVNYEDRTSCVLWGDASSAAILSPRHKGKFELMDTMLRGDPSGAEKVKVPRAGHFTQQGAAVQTFAIKRASETYSVLRESFMKRFPNRNPSTLSLIGHQANLRMLEAVKTRAEVSDERHLYNVDRRGNCGAAGAPSVLSEKWDDAAAVGDAVAMCVVGSGLTWAGALFVRT